MTTVEELQSMTHEDLVRRVQELEQDLKEVKEQSDMWFDSFTRLQARHESSINALDILAGIDASDRVEFYLPGSNTAASVFDHTFDFTFRGLLNMATKITCKVDNSDCGIYLRWINRHGMWCYWLFMQGDETSQVSNDGEFIRNNMQDYSYKNGYHGGSGRKQRKMEETTLPVCAPLIDSITYDFLYQMATSPVVDMFMGYDDNGNARWMAVNVSVGNFVKQRVSLQDFEANIILPETNVQSL